MDNRILEIILRARDEASKVIEKAGGQITSSFDKATSASRSFALGLAGVGVAAAGVVGMGAHVAADLETSRQGFITLFGSAEEADRILKQIKIDAAKTPFELPGLIQANQLLTSVTKDGQRSETFLLNIGKALAAMGKGQNELDRIIVNLQQIGAVGKASMLDLKQFAFAGIPIFELLQTHTGKTGEALEAMIADGQVTFELLEELFNKAGSSGGRFAKAFTDQSGTFNQSLSNAKDTLQIFLAELVTSTGLFDLLKDALKGFVEFMNAHGDEILEGVRVGLKWVRDNGPIVAGIIVGALTPALIAFAGAVVAATAVLLPYIAAGAALGLVAKVLIDNWGPISGFFTSLWTTVTNAFSTGITFVTQTVPAFIEQTILWFQQLPDRVGAFFADLFVQKIPYAVGFAAGWLMTAVPQLVTNLIGWFAQLPGQVAGIFETTKNWIISKVQQAWSWLSGEVSAWPGRVGGFLASLPGVVAKIFDSAKDAAIGKMQELFRGVSDLWNKVKGIFDAIRGAAEAAIGAVQRGFEAGRNAGMRAFADGGWVNGTGPAILHDKEYVLSPDMLSGRQAVDPAVLARLGARSNSIQIGPVYVRNESDIQSLGQRMAYYLQTSGNL